MGDNSKIENSPLKIVSLIATVVTVLACIVGAVTWISATLTNNAVSIEGLRTTQLRHEVLISKNSEIINQHAQLLAIIKEQGKAIDVLTEFMTQGGRFTASDGKILHDEVAQVKERFQRYGILEAELGWIKESIRRLEEEITVRFDSLHEKLNVSPRME